MNYTKIIGSNIRYERKLRGLTIDDFAKVIGMAPGFVGLIERGQRGTSITNMVKIAEFFDITLDELITKDLSLGKASTPKSVNRVEKDRRALISMINTMAEDKVQILAANAKALNKYIPTPSPKEAMFEEADAE
ncbi:MAG: helix-turn-helix transcriptional regulator [Clostridia bacterium]|nr:helix-turn-helix transcriptional regulator [Clostridia bacterium]